MLARKAVELEAEDPPDPPEASRLDYAVRATGGWLMNIPGIGLRGADQTELAAAPTKSLSTHPRFFPGLILVLLTFEQMAAGGRRSGSVWVAL